MQLGRRMPTVHHVLKALCWSLLLAKTCQITSSPPLNFTPILRLLISRYRSRLRHWALGTGHCRMILRMTSAVSCRGQCWKRYNYSHKNSILVLSWRSRFGTRPYQLLTKGKHQLSNCQITQPQPRIRNKDGCYFIYS